MKDEIKSELDALFADDAGRQVKAEQKRNLEAEHQASFVEAFDRKVAEVIVPAFEDFIAYLRPNGWGGTVKHEAATLREQNYGRGFPPPMKDRVALAFSHATRSLTGINRTDEPKFSITCDKVKREVTFHESTPSMAGGAGSAKLDDVSGEFIQKRLVVYFKKLLNDARPRDAR